MAKFYRLTGVVRAIQYTRQNLSDVVDFVGSSYYMQGSGIVFPDWQSSIGEVQLDDYVIKVAKSGGHVFRRLRPLDFSTLFVSAEAVTVAADVVSWDALGVVLKLREAEESFDERRERELHRAFSMASAITSSFTDELLKVMSG